MKDDEWGGMFVDFLDCSVADKSVFKMVVVKSGQVCRSVLISCHFATMSLLL